MILFWEKILFWETLVEGLPEGLGPIHLHLYHEAINFRTRFEPPSSALYLLMPTPRGGPVKRIKPSDSIQGQEEFVSLPSQQKRPSQGRLSPPRCCLLLLDMPKASSSLARSRLGSPVQARQLPVLSSGGYLLQKRQRRLALAMALPVLPLLRRCRCLISLP